MFFKRKPKVNLIDLGVVDDPRGDEEKQKDYKAEELASFAPIEWEEKDETEWRKFPIFNQSTSSSCVAQAIAKILGIENFLEEGKFIALSARHIYFRRKNAPAKGMWFQNAMELGHEGATFEQLLPSQGLNEVLMNNKLDLTPLDSLVSKPARGGNYLAIPLNIDAVASIIEPEGKPVVLGFRFGPNEWDKKVPEIKGTDTRYHHAVVATNALLYNGQKALVIEDSWGDNRGIAGRRIITEDWFEAMRVSAAWYFKALKNDGSTIKPTYNFENDLAYGLRNNNEVKKLQECLAHLNLFPTDVDFTGNFYGITLKAVKNFQKKYNISPVSGFVGPLTREKLNELFN